MQPVPTNFIAVLVAAVVGMVIGGLWYSPLLFAKQWMAWSGKTPADLEAAKKKGMTLAYVLMFVGTFLMAYVLHHALVFASAYLNVSGAWAGMTAGFWNWLGFIAPVTLGTVLWDGKPWKLWMLNNVYYLLVLLIMGVILAVWM